MYRHIKIFNILELNEYIKVAGDILRRSVFLIFNIPKCNYLTK